MNTLIQLVITIMIFTIIYLVTRVKPEWFMGVNHTKPRETVGVETESDDQKRMRIADDALFGPSCSNHEPRITEGSTGTSFEACNATDTSKGMKNT